VVGSADCGKLFYMIDGLDSSIKSMFAGLSKSLVMRETEGLSVRKEESCILCVC